MKNRSTTRTPQKLIFSAMLLLPLSLLAEAIVPVPRPIAPKPPVAPKPPAVMPKPLAPVNPGTGPSTTPKAPTVTAPKAKAPTGSHEAGSAPTPKSGGSRSTVDYEATKEMLIKDLEIQKLLKKESIDIKSDAMKGLVTEHELYNRITGLGEPTHKKAGKFELALAEKLVGKDKLKELKKEDIEDLQALTCSSKCGHSNFKLSCRRITRFLTVASGAGLTGATLATAFYHFMNSDSEPTDGGKSIEVSSDDGKTIKVDQLGDDTRVPEEQVSSTEESK